jgi:hypothetical protein
MAQDPEDHDGQCLKMVPYDTWGRPQIFDILGKSARQETSFHGHDLFSVSCLPFPQQVNYSSSFLIYFNYQ